MTERLSRIGELEVDKKLVLFIDGLDEFTEIRRFIPESQKWLKIIISSRPVEEIIDWIRLRDRGNKTEMEIEPFSIADIRALLYDVVDKYQDGFNSKYIDKVAERSEGNPLYLHLLCDKIYSEGGIVSDVNAIPKDIDDLYTDTIKRITEKGKNKNVLDLLHLLSEAKASLSVPVISEFLKINSTVAKSAVDACREILFEDPLTPEVDDFQLFHESLREWLREKHKIEIKDMSVKLADICFDYKIQTSVN